MWTWVLKRERLNFATVSSWPGAGSAALISTGSLDGKLSVANLRHQRGKSTPTGSSLEHCECDLAIEVTALAAPIHLRNKAATEIVQTSILMILSEATKIMGVIA